MPTKPDKTSAARRCTATGVRLVPSGGKVVYRVAKESWGPLNPRLRLPDSDRQDWGRYDVLGHLTVYCGHPEVASYAESMAWAKVALSDDGPLLRELFDDVDKQDETSLLSAIESEWADLHHMRPGKVAKAWRTERSLYELTLPPSGWFVDIESAETISAITEAMGPKLVAEGVDQQLTTADLRGRNRELTTAIAGWLWALVLDDGSLPHGIRFGSKHDSSWSCWAVWLRAADDGNPSGEQIKANDGVEITDCEHNPPLAQVAELFNLHVQ